MKRLDNRLLNSSRVTNIMKRLSSRLSRSRFSTLMKMKHQLDHSQNLPLVSERQCEVNDEGLPLDTRVNTRLSRVCGLAAWQRVSLAL
jgi:hypothetical protein